LSTRCMTTPPRQRWAEYPVCRLHRRNQMRA
jgi:hypothetical protein